MLPNEFLAKMDKDISNTGRSIMGVINSHNYTIGQGVRKQPDVIITCNMNHQTASAILNDVCERFEDGKLNIGKSDQILRGFDAYLLPCTVNIETLITHYVMQAERYYERKGVECAGYLQLVLPDASGLFPWEKGYGEGMPPQDIFCEVPATVH